MYSGRGLIKIPFMLNQTFTVLFESLFINELGQAGEGKVWFKTKPIEEWIAQQIEQTAANALQEQQETNQETFADTEFYPEPVTFDNNEVTGVSIDAQGNIILNTTNGVFYADTTLVPKPRTKAVVIEDKNGNQWVIEPNGTITAAPGGGLPAPHMNVSAIAGEITRLAFDKLVALQNTNATAINQEYTRVQGLVNYPSVNTAPPITPSGDVVFGGELIALGTLPTSSPLYVKSNAIKEGEINYYLKGLVLHMNTIYNKINHFKYVAAYSFVPNANDMLNEEKNIAKYIDEEVAKDTAPLTTAEKNTIAEVVKGYLATNFKYYIIKNRKK